MKIKRIRKLKVNSFTFNIKWVNTEGGASFSYGDKEMVFHTKDFTDEQLLMLVCHELMEVCAIELNVRMMRPDCETDYIFVYDHRQHETITNMFAGLLSQFLE